MNLRVFAIFLGIVALPIGMPVAANQNTEQSAERGDSTTQTTPLIVYIGTNDYLPENTEAAAEAGVQLGIYNLDAHRNLENRLTEGLPTTPGMMKIEDVQRIVEQRFNALSPEEVKSIFEPVSLAQRWDIRKVPVFVFGAGAAVIYGITDVAVALEYWRYWRNSQGDPIGETP